jgi:aldehyde:ferredoxin oxidoreductase
VVCGKSPATGLWGESNIGGFWGVELRKAGFDGLWITGKAKEPVYLFIHNREVEIRVADHLWGKDTYQVQEAIQEEVGYKKARVAAVGIAGENKINFASIMCDHGRLAGRTGLGAVMGAKNLKAVAVLGTGKIPVADETGFSLLRSKVNKELRNDNMTRTLRELGTAGGAEYFDYLGSMPKRGFSTGTMDGIETISGAYISDKYLVGVSACHGCVVACGRVVKQPKASTKQKGPEYETLVGFGPNLWINDPEFIFRMNDLCDRYGMDTISTSNTIAFAFRLFELGYLTEGDTQGMSLKWGDKSAVEQLINQIGQNTGFGKILAKGSKSLGERFGAKDLAIQVNGLEVPYHDPRGMSGYGLVYATSPRGACHNQSDYFIVEMGQAEEELGITFLSRFEGAGKAGNVARHQDWRTVFNALVICILGNVPPNDLASIVNKSTGYERTLDDLLLVGERGWTLKRIINNRLGLTRKNDRLPDPLLEPLEDGGAAGSKLDLEPMLREYYQKRGWDWLSGYPTREKIRDLNLDFSAKDLWPDS